MRGAVARSLAEEADQSLDVLCSRCHVSYEEDGKPHQFTAVMLNVYKAKGGIGERVARTMQPTLLTLSSGQGPAKRSASSHPDHWFWQEWDLLICQNRARVIFHQGLSNILSISVRNKPPCC